MTVQKKSRRTPDELFPSRSAVAAPPSTHCWKPVSFGFLPGLSDALVRFELEHPGRLPDLRQDHALYITSDYSGEHAGAPFEVYSFLVAQMHDVLHWARHRGYIRAALLEDGRRMSFKSLGDRQRARALPPFLLHANSLRGLLLTVAVKKTAGSLFAASEPRPGLAKRWRPNVFEKVLRVAHLSGVLMAGLSRPGQSILWVTDNDAIAASTDHLRDFTNLLMLVSSNILSHSLGHLRCTTTGIADDGSRTVEDLAAIADLSAGFMADYLRARVEGFTAPPSAKMQLLSPWFVARDELLCRIFFTVEGQADGPLNAATLRFHEPKPP
jgi:hypothetical protein